MKRASLALIIPFLALVLVVDLGACGTDDTEHGSEGVLPADGGAGDGGALVDGASPDGGEAGGADTTTDGGAGQAGSHPGAFHGYTLFSPLKHNETFLINMDGKTVHHWQNDCAPASMPYLLEDGSILRPCEVRSPRLRGGAVGGRIQRISWDGQILWDWTYSTDKVQQHYDIDPLPNGNLILIAWELKTAQEATAVGMSTAVETWPLHIVEVKPEGKTGGTIVWKWHAWDHLVQNVDPQKPNYGKPVDHPGRLDINFGTSRRGGDWIHANCINYNPIRDEIVFSSHFFHEVFIIDHSTSTAEAAGKTGGKRGKGGDILYRWGNPQVYGAGGSGDQQIFVVHGSTWIPPGLPGAGNIMFFNNGDRSGNNNDWSVVQEIVPPRDKDGNYLLTPGKAYGPAKPVWSYSNKGSFYSNHLAGARRLPNGNTLIVEATTGHLFEVTSAGKVVWEYTFSSGGRKAQIARAMRYSPDHPGLARLKN